MDAIPNDRVNQAMFMTLGLTLFGLLPSLVVQLIGGRYRITFALGGFLLLFFAGIYPYLVDDLVNPAPPLGAAAFAIALLLGTGASALVLAPSGPGWFVEEPRRWPWRWSGFLWTVGWLLAATVLFNMVGMAAHGVPLPSAGTLVLHLGYRVLYSLVPGLLVSVLVQTLFGRNRVSLVTGGVVAAWAAFIMHSAFDAYLRDPAAFAN